MLGKRIRAARKARSIAQADLARLVGVQPLTMWRYEDGRSTPGIERLGRIATALGVTIDFLVRGAPRKPRKRKRVRSTPPPPPLRGEALSA